MRTQSIPLSEFKQNLVKFIEMLRSPNSEHYSPDTTIFLISPPPICVPQRAADVERRFGPGLELDRSFERTQDFAKAVKEVAQECKVSYVPAFEAIMHAAGPDYDTGLPKYLSDGLHLTPAGYQASLTSSFVSDILILPSGRGSGPPGAPESAPLRAVARQCTAALPWMGVCAAVSVFWAIADVSLTAKSTQRTRMPRSQSRSGEGLETPSTLCRKRAPDGGCFTNASYIVNLMHWDLTEVLRDGQLLSRSGL
jgi:hypothetical protein